MIQADSENAALGGIRAVQFERRRWWFALFVVLLFAAALRVWNFDYEVGRRFTYDTADKLAQALRVADGNLVPSNWKQPYFLPYVGGALLWAVGLFRSISTDDAKALLTLMMVGFSLGSVALTALTATRLFQSRPIGLLSALLLSVTPINVVGSRYIKEDMPLLFLVQLSMYWLSGLLVLGRRRDYLLSGLATGLAIGTKFSGVLLVPLLVLAHGLRIRSLGGRLDRGLSHLLLGGALIPVGFFLLNPVLLAHLGQFVDGFLFQAKYSAGAHHDGTRVSPWSHYWLFYFRRALVPGITWALVAPLLLALSRFVADRETRKPGVVFVVVWVVLAYLTFEQATAKPFPFFARYIHPLIPALCMLSAWSLWELEEALAPWLRASSVFWVRAGAIALSIGLPLGHSAVITHGISDDTRLKAARWIDRELPHGARIAFDDPIYSPRPQRKDLRTKYFGPFARPIHQRRVEDLAASGFQYLVLNSFRSERFRITRRDSEKAQHADAFFRSVREKCRLFATIAPDHAIQSYGFHNPIIEVYELPRDLR